MTPILLLSSLKTHMAGKLMLNCFKNTKHLVAFNWINMYLRSNIFLSVLQNCRLSRNCTYQYLSTAFPEEPMGDLGSQYFSQN